MREIQYRTMGLRECAAFDHQNGLRDQLTGWARVSLDRAERGISRKARRIARLAAEAKRKAEAEAEAA